MQQGGNSRVIVAEILEKGKPVRQSNWLFVLGIQRLFFRCALDGEKDSI